MWEVVMIGAEDLGEDCLVPLYTPSLSYDHTQQMCAV